MQYIKNKLKKIYSLNYQEYRDAITSKEDILKRAYHVKSLKDNPILTIILNQLEVSTADNIAGASLYDEKKIIGLTAYLKAIRDLKNEISALVEIAEEIAKNDK